MTAFYLNGVGYKEAKIDRDVGEAIIETFYLNGVGYKGG